MLAVGVCEDGNSPFVSSGGMFLIGLMLCLGL